MVILNAEKRTQCSSTTLCASYCSVFDIFPRLKFSYIYIRCTHLFFPFSFVFFSSIFCEFVNVERNPFINGCNRIYIERNAFQLFGLQNLYLYERKGLDGRRNGHKYLFLEWVGNIDAQKFATAHRSYIYK